MNRSLVVLAASLVVAGCRQGKQQRVTVQTVAAERLDIVVDAEATGVVEPINVVEVKSKASGQIVQMPVETGSQVKPGELLVQVDTRDVRNQYSQALADVRAAQARVDVVAAQKKRSDDLFAQRIITAQEYEAAQLEHANAQAQLVRSRSNLDLAQQRLEDATVRAPVAGTVIEKTVSLGQVIASATGSVTGGTTLLKMADLSQVRVRALVNESDIGNIQAGQQATVTVDAYPERPFRGFVEKIEPQAVVQQSVTMFPVLVSVSNREGLLKPGMNGEVSVLVDRRENVLAVPNDAIRNPREAATIAPALGLDPQDVQRQLQSQAAGGPGAPSGPVGAAPAAGNANRSGAPLQVARGDVALDRNGGGAPQQGRRQQGARVGQEPQVSAQQCDSVRVALEKNPQARGKLDSIRERTRTGQAEMQQARDEMQAVYRSLGLDPGVVRACLRQTRAGDDAAAPQGARQAPLGELTEPETPALSRVRARPGLVFVAQNGGFVPRIVRLGVSNYDYTEVLSGLQEGDRVAVLTAAAMQQQRQQSLDQMRQRQAMPGMGGAPAGGQGGRPGGGAARGGGRP